LNYEFKIAEICSRIQDCPKPIQISSTTVIMKKKIEILAPAKDLIQGMAAINSGADAVYIGAPLFGARSNATNSVEDVAQLVSYAHLFNA
jgi:hypothetical protein